MVSSSGEPNRSAFQIPLTLIESGAEIETWDVGNYP